MDTQVTLSEQQVRSLADISEQTGKELTILISEAVEQFIARFQPLGQRTAFRQACGMWKDRDDLPDFGQLRREADRSFNEGQI